MKDYEKVDSEFIHPLLKPNCKDAKSYRPDDRLPLSCLSVLWPGLAPCELRVHRL